MRAASVEHSFCGPTTVVVGGAEYNPRWWPWWARRSVLAVRPGVQFSPAASSVVVVIGHEDDDDDDDADDEVERGVYRAWVVSVVCFRRCDVTTGRRTSSAE